MRDVIAELTVFPLGEGESLHDRVGKVLDLIRESGLDFAVNPMGTCIEGPFDAVWQLVGRCHDLLAAEHPRVYLTVKLDSRESDATTGRMAAKLAAVGAAEVTKR